MPQSRRGGANRPEPTPRRTMSIAALQPRRPVSQPRLFQRLRWHILRNTLGALLDGSRVRAVTIVLCSALVWGAVYAVSRAGFAFLNLQNIFLGGGIVGTLFDLLFLSLTVLLIFSSGIILYSSLFSSAECAFLLSTPARADQVFAYKYQGALAFSSWAFFLLGSPILIAHGIAYGAPWYFYPLLFIFLIGFVLVPGSLGALCCLAVVNFLPRHRKQALIAAVALIVLALGVWVYQLQPAAFADNYSPDFIRRLVGQLAYAQGPLAPNHWMSRGLMAAAHGELDTAVYCLALVMSNGLFLYLLTAWAAGRLYRRGYNRVATAGLFRRRYGGIWLDGLLDRSVSFLDSQTRLLIVKDFRTFRRDPAQWAQVLIFTGLIALYFTNMRQFYQNEGLGQIYQNAVSLINLAATALLLCSYTGRFIYPMLSLEGNKFWVLGLLPMRRERLLWGKFAFSAIWSLIISEFLIIFSDVMLGMWWFVIVTHALTVAVIALGLSGLSVGLGASMPNFRESDPSKIAVGFGGTLNLVAGLLFLLMEILLMAAPWHIRVAYSMGTASQPEVNSSLLVGIAAGVALGVAAVVIPLRTGARSLRRMEF
jgi:ABC-2 type transport system permease protein